VQVAAIRIIHLASVPQDIKKTTPNNGTIILHLPDFKAAMRWDAAFDPKGFRFLKQITVTSLGATRRYGVTAKTHPPNTCERFYVWQSNMARVFDGSTFFNNFTWVCNRNKDVPEEKREEKEEQKEDPDYEEEQEGALKPVKLISASAWWKDAITVSQNMYEVNSSERLLMEKVPTPMYRLD
jgi:hypothetical protein